MTQRFRRRRAPRALGLVLLVGWAAPALAVEGVIEINAAKAAAGGVTSSDTGGVPVTIDAPGSYRLTGNVSASVAPIGGINADPENFTVIEITADDVGLDLNGFTISGPGIPGTGDGVRSTGANTVVRNGIIRGLGQDGLDLGDGARVEDCTVVGNGQDGVETGANSRVVDCVVQGNAGYGLNLGGASAFGRNVLTGNNGGAPNPQVASKGRDPVEIGGNVCGDGTGCSFDTPPDKLVFALAIQGGGGNLGGLLGADGLCQNEALGGGFPGVFLAWLSDGIDSPNTRFTKSPGRYKLVTGTTVALDYADLTDGTLLNPIDRAASGVGLLSPDTWTNVTPAGSPTGGLPQMDHCAGWNDGGSIFGGNIGSNQASDSTWTQAGQVLCNLDTVFIYCFEQ